MDVKLDDYSLLAVSADDVHIFFGRLDKSFDSVRYWNSESNDVHVLDLGVRIDEIISSFVYSDFLILVDNNITFHLIDVRSLSYSGGVSIASGRSSFPPVKLSGKGVNGPIIGIDPSGVAYELDLINKEIATRECPVNCTHVDLVDNTYIYFETNLEKITSYVSYSKSPNVGGACAILVGDKSPEYYFSDVIGLSPDRSRVLVLDKSTLVIIDVSSKEVIDRINIYALTPAPINSDKLESWNTDRGLLYLGSTRSLMFAWSDAAILSVLSSPRFVHSETYLYYMDSESGWSRIDTNGILDSGFSSKTEKFIESELTISGVHNS